MGAVVIAVAGRAERASSVPRVLGVDLSLSSTGLALSDFRGMRTDVIPTKAVDGYRAAVLRQRYILERVGSWLAQPVDLVVLEDPTQAGHVAAVSAKLSERSGLFWQALDLLDRLALPFAVASPSTLKVYATDDGNAGKPAMVAAARAQFPRAGIAKDDEADAAWLAAMGSARLGFVVDAASGHKRRSAQLGKVEWPELLAD